MTRLRIAPEAEEELAAAAEWYELQRTGLGVELVVAVDRALDAIVAAPLSNPTWRSDRAYRKRALTSFPYVIFFILEEDVVFVVAIAHDRRRPGYWSARAPA